MLRQSKNGFRRQVMHSMMTLALCAAPLMAGKLDDKVKSPLLVSQIQLPMGGPIELSLHNVDGKRYLYAYRPQERSFTVLDVSNEYSPRVLKTWKHDGLSRTRTLHALPSGDILVAQSTTTSSSDGVTNYNLYVLDAFGAQEGTQVGAGSAHLFESRRGLLYVMDAKGLAIIRLHESPEEIDYKRWTETMTP
jgi:hypothetical protein